MATTASKVTNQEFAEAVGCDFTMASRLRNGNRLPSAALVHAIHEAYGIDYRDLMNAHAEGDEAFGELLRKRIFFPPARKGGKRK